MNGMHTGDGLTAGVMGFPVDHSLSPAIHNAIYAAQGLPWRYGLCPTPTDDDMRACVAQGRRRAERVCGDAAAPPAFCGFNVTTPGKALAFRLADHANPSAHLVGFANTLTFVDAAGAPALGAAGGGARAVALAADTTDGLGACRALAACGQAVAGARVLVLGTGGAAMSIVCAAYLDGAAQVLVASRDPARARTMLEGLGTRGDALAHEGVIGGWGFGPRKRDVPWRHPVESGRCLPVGYDGIERVARTADIVINATPLGMNAGDPSPLPATSFRAGQLAMDAVYAHGTTAFVSDARAAGARAIDGLPMLVQQALLSIAIWCEAQGVAFDPDDPLNLAALRDAGVLPAS